MSEIFYINRNAVLFLDDDVSDVLHVADQTEAADVIELAALGIEAAARVGVVAAELAGDLRDGDAVGKELVGIQQHLVLHGGAAKTGVVGNALDGAVVAFQHPVLDGLQFLRRAVGALDDVTINQTAGAEQWRDAGLQSVGHGRVGDALKGLLADKVGVGAVLEIHFDGGQTVEGNGAQVLQPRDAVHFDFQRNGDQAFHFFGGVAGPLRDDFHVGRRKIGIGVNGQLQKRERAPDHKGQGRDHNEEPLPQGEGD